jgi:predicted TIM-barrel fold metal-dependent hydrolase
MTMSAPLIAPPDPNTRTPVFKAPPLTCDTHCHIFGPSNLYPYAPDRTYTPPDAPLNMFRSLHGKIGVERAVIVNASAHGFDNRVVTDAIAQSNGRYKGIANISPTITDAELEQLNAQGIKGCRFTFLKRLGGVRDMAAFHRIVERIKALDWHVDIYLDHETVEEFTPLLKSLPIPYVIDHMGTVLAAKGLDQANFQHLLALVRMDEKCWVKLTGFERATASGAPFHDAVPFAEALMKAAPERMLWGTDWPHPNVKHMPNDGDLMDLVPLFATDEHAQKLLLVENPARLFGFSD